MNQRCRQAIVASSFSTTRAEHRLDTELTTPQKRSRKASLVASLFSRLKMV
jgi:hypothetical protein